jgi:hypothetical protein
MDGLDHANGFTADLDVRQLFLQVSDRGLAPLRE